MTRAAISVAVMTAVVSAVAVWPTAARFALAAPQVERGRTIPPPAVDAAPTQAPTEVAVLAGGCFWDIQAVFQQTSGVASAVSGYAGGQKQTARYEIVGRGGTGHAEAVQVTFDPRQISYAQVLHVFFSVAHNPTQLNRQGPDTGHQYRSAIFPASAEQARQAEAYIAQLDQARAYASPIVTQIEPGREFFAAEDYHQDFMTKHPTHPYIAYHDLPKLESLKRLFPDRYRVRPALVSGSSQ
jgi:peptide-methionine (S)-S-oxide reductase